MRIAAFSSAVFAAIVGCSAEVTPPIGDYDGTLLTSLGSQLGPGGESRRPAVVHVDATDNGYSLTFGDECRIRVAQTGTELTIEPGQTCRLPDYVLGMYALTVDENWSPARVQLDAGRLDFVAAFATQYSTVGVRLEFHGAR